MQGSCWLWDVNSHFLFLTLIPLLRFVCFLFVPITFSTLRWKNRKTAWYFLLWDSNETHISTNYGAGFLLLKELSVFEQWGLSKAIALNTMKGLTETLEVKPYKQLSSTYMKTVTYYTEEFRTSKCAVFLYSRSLLFQQPAFFFFIYTTLGMHLCLLKNSKSTVHTVRLRDEVGLTCTCKVMQEKDSCI